MLPPIIAKQWHTELRKFSGNLFSDLDISTVLKATDKIRPHSKVVIVPYSIMDRLVEGEKIHPAQFGMVIADESHNLKNIEAKRTNCALPFLHKAVVAVCLTGTPALNRPMELYSQLNGVLPNVFNDLKGFGVRYCDAKPSRFANTMEYKGSCNEHELKMVLEGLVMVRRLKEDVIHDMPEKHRELRQVEPDPEYVPEIARMKKRQDTIDNELKKGVTEETRLKLVNEQRQLLQSLYHVTGMSKLRAIREELFRLVDEARLERARAESDALLAESNGENDSAGEEEGEGAVQLDGFDYFQRTQEMTLRSTADDSTVELVLSRSNSIDSNEAIAEEAAVDNEAVAAFISSSRSAGRAGSAAVLMEIEDDLMNEDDNYWHDGDEPQYVSPAKKKCQSSAKSSAAQHSEDDDDLHDSADDRDAADTQLSAGTKRRRLQRGCIKSSSSAVSLSAKKSEVEEWAPSDEDCEIPPANRRKHSGGGRDCSRKTRRFDDEDIEAEASFGEEDDDDDDYLATHNTKRKQPAVSTTSATANKKQQGKKSAFDEMKSAAASMKSPGTDEKKPGSAKKGKKVTKVSRAAAAKATAALAAAAAPKQFRGLGKKILLFVHHKSVMDALEDSLRERAVQFIRIDGTVTGPARNHLIAKFQDDDLVRCYMSNSICS